MCLLVNSPGAAFTHNQDGTGNGSELTALLYGVSDRSEGMSRWPPGTITRWIGSDIGSTDPRRVSERPKRSLFRVAAEVQAENRSLALFFFLDAVTFDLGFFASVEVFLSGRLTVDPRCLLANSSGAGITQQTAPEWIRASSAAFWSIR
jgi:hypothetical protein